MKKVFFLMAVTILSIQSCVAITEDDKAAIRAIIDETYKYVYYNPAPEASDKARQYVRDEYFYKYLKCKNSCEVEWNKVRAKANNFSVFTNQEAINQEARQTFDNCMVENCNYIKEVQVKECHEYIEQYINSKKK